MSSFATFYFIPCIQCSTEITHIKFQLTPVIKRPIFAVPNTPQKTLKIHQFFFPPPIFLKLYRVQVLGTLTQNAKFQSPTLPRSFFAIRFFFFENRCSRTRGNDVTGSDVINILITGSDVTGSDVTTRSDVKEMSYNRK